MTKMKEKNWKNGGIINQAFTVFNMEKFASENKTPDSKEIEILLKKILQN